MEIFSVTETTRPPPTVFQKGSSSWTHNCLDYFLNFCDNTSIHGFKFLGEKKRCTLEKIFWLAVLAVSFYGAYTLITNTYNKWTTSPILVTFAMTETPIWKVPFPAVTICPETKFNRSEFNYTYVINKFNTKKKLAGKELRNFLLSIMVCNDFNYRSGWLAVSGATHTISNTEMTHFQKMLTGVKFNRCEWQGEPIGSNKLFFNFETSEGLCKTFNMLDYNDLYHTKNLTRNRNKTRWTMENGYPDDENLNTFPKRTFLSGLQGGLQVDMYVADKDLDFFCTAFQGFKVILHHPAENPDVDKHFVVPLNKAVVVGIKPRMISTSEEIRGYRPEKRQCYLPGEKNLLAFKIYTQQNCLLECLIQFTEKKCYCVPFYLTSYLPFNKSCGVMRKRCINEAKVQFLKNELQAPTCQCLPSCNDIEYEAETSITDWNWKQSNDGGLFRPNVSRYHMSRLQIYYKNSQFMTSERHEFYGLIDFLANCGGLLGFCCGFSLVSLIEIIYFLTLRLIGNLMRYRKVYDVQQVSGSATIWNKN